MAITPLPTPPTRSDPASFSARGDAFMSALPQFVLEANQLALTPNIGGSSGSSLVGHIGAGAGAVATTVQDSLRVRVRAAEYGAIGSASDETTNLQAALNAAAGKTLELANGATYKYTSITVPQDTKIISNGATFNRLSASTTHGITIERGVVADKIIVTTPGGSNGDKGVLINGDDVSIGILRVTASAQGVYNSTNYALEIESVPSGTHLSNIKIGRLECSKFSTLCFAKNVGNLFIESAQAEYYRTAFYLRDVSRSRFGKTLCRYLGNAVNGSPGENGLLIESTLFSDSSRHLSFEDWTVEDSGEHAYRLGGQLSITDVYFRGCKSTRSGSSILTGNLTSGEWHGGCGFKILGGNSTTTEFHKNIYLNSCIVEDCNTTYGSYPAAHGVNNFSPYLVVMAKNIHLDNCSIAAKGQPIAARNGLLTANTDGLYLDNCNFDGVDLVPLNPYEETPIGGFPGSDGPVTNFYVNGGSYSCMTASAGSGVGLYMQQNAKYAHRNWIYNGVTFKGGASAVRLETVSTGSYENIVLDFTYLDSNVTDATYTSPVVVGGTYATVSVKAPWRPLAFSPAVLNGSTWQDTLGGQLYEKSDSVWRRNTKTYSAVIADDSFATFAPPAADVGFVFISGGGTSTNLMGWYRATSSPQSSKYAGSAATAMVNTALTGTTGVDGNVTVGVQNGLIYVENRNGASNTFKVTFQ